MGSGSRAWSRSACAATATRPMTQGTAINLLERIVADQRRIIADVTGKPPSKRRRSGRSTRKCRTTTTRGCASPTTSPCCSRTTTGARFAGCPQPKLAAARRVRRLLPLRLRRRPRNYKWLNTNQIAKRGSRWISPAARRPQPVDRERRRHQADGVSAELFHEIGVNPQAMTLAALAQYPQEWARRHIRTGAGQRDRQAGESLQPARGDAQAQARSMPTASD